MGGVDYEPDILRKDTEIFFYTFRVYRDQESVRLLIRIITAGIGESSIQL